MPLARKEKVLKQQRTHHRVRVFEAKLRHQPPHFCHQISAFTATVMSGIRKKERGRNSPSQQSSQWAITPGICWWQNAIRTDFLGWATAAHLSKVLARATRTPIPHKKIEGPLSASAEGYASCIVHSNHGIDEDANRHGDASISLMARLVHEGLASSDRNCTKASANFPRPQDEYHGCPRKHGI